MKNMKKLVAVIAVFAMMLSMATVVFAGPLDKFNPATETFAIVLDSKDIVEGTTDTFTIKANITFTSPSSAAKGLAALDLTVQWDTSVLEYVSWTVAEGLNKTMMVTGEADFNNGSNGSLLVSYMTADVNEAIQSGQYYEFTFKLADGVEAGASTAVTVKRAANVSAFDKNSKPTPGWIQTRDTTPFETPGAVNVISDQPEVPVVTDGEQDLSFGNEDPKDNFYLQWGSLANTDLLDDNYKYGIVVFDGEGDFDATTEGAVVYEALGNKEGLFGVKLIGNLLEEGLRIRTYLFDGTNYTYGN